MNIVEAIKAAEFHCKNCWKIRRKSYAKGDYIYSPNSIVQYYSDILKRSEPWMMGPESLVAEDWEVYKEVYIFKGIKLTLAKKNDCEFLAPTAFDDISSFGILPLALAENGKKYTMTLTEE